MAVEAETEPGAVALENADRVRTVDLDVRLAKLSQKPYRLAAQIMTKNASP